MCVVDLLYLCLYHLRLFPQTESSSVTSASVALILLVAIVVQLLSHVQLFVTPCGVPGSPVLQYLSTFAQIHIHWVGDALCASQRMDFCLLLPSTFPSSRVFSLMVSTINTEEPVLANACCRGHILCSTLHPLSQQFGLTVAVVTSCPQV